MKLAAAIPALVSSETPEHLKRTALTFVNESLGRSYTSHRQAAKAALEAIENAYQL
jgi:hypothetical protein